MLDQPRAHTPNCSTIPPHNNRHIKATQQGAQSSHNFIIVYVVIYIALYHLRTLNLTSNQVRKLGHRPGDRTIGTRTVLLLVPIR